MPNPRDNPKPPGSSAWWLYEIDNASRIEGDWRKSAARVTQRYREEDLDVDSEGRRDGASRFNILYANIAVLRPAIFQNAPRPDVRRRWDVQSDNPELAAQFREAAAQASTILERALSYVIDKEDFKSEAASAIDDMLLPGRGVLRVRYEAQTDEEPDIDDEGLPVVDEDGEPVLLEEISGQRVWTEYVYWKDVRFEPARRWSRHAGPGWVAFRHTFLRADAVDEFGKAKADSLKYDWAPEEAESEKDYLGEESRAEVWEIWDRRAGEVVWVNKGPAKPIAKDDDPLELQDFYPMPRPLYAYKTNDTLTPISELKAYADLAAELDAVTARISRLTDRLRATFGYDAAIEGIEEIMKGDDGTGYPLKNFQVAEGRRLEDTLLWPPIQNIVTVLQQLYRQRETILQTIFQVVGISDILRGSSDPNETLGAQRIKTQFGTLRIDERRRNVNDTLRDALRLMAEIIAEKFEPEFLAEMTGIEPSAEAMQILRDEGLRGFIIDVESDSTVAPDEQAEQEAVTKLITGLSQFFTAMAPLVQQGLMTGAQVVQLARFAIRPFRGARNLEEVLDEAERNLEQLAEAGGAGGDDEGGKDAAQTEKAKVEAEEAKALAPLNIRLKELEVAKARATP